MNLEINSQLFIIGGATSGFGEAVSKALLKEGATVIAVARREEKLQELKAWYPEQVIPVCVDITQPEAIEAILNAVRSRQVNGMLVNAGGPPAMSAMEATLNDWDEAYRTVFRWKVDLVRAILPSLIEKKYGRIVFIESSSVKQPIENLVLSNSMRLAVVGYVKTLSQEIARKGITLNILAPGSHATSAINRLITKKVEQTGASTEEVKSQYIQQIGVGFLGNPDDLAGLAIWLLSPESRFITGQTISVDGGVIKGIMG